MKKSLILLAFLLLLVGCSGNRTKGLVDEEKKEELIPKEEVAPQEVKEISTSENKEKPAKPKPIVTVNQVPYTLEIQKPDSIGNIYGVATYTNNSNYPITGLQLIFHRKIENDKSYFSTYDTILPGETSPKFSAPSEAEIADMELIKVYIAARNEKGNEVQITYDVKLDEYKITEVVK